MALFFEYTKKSGLSVSLSNSTAPRTLAMELTDSPFYCFPPTHFIPCPLFPPRPPRPRPCQNIPKPGLPLPLKNKHLVQRSELTQDQASTHHVSPLIPPIHFALLRLSLSSPWMYPLSFTNDFSGTKSNGSCFYPTLVFTCWWSNSP